MDVDEKGDDADKSVMLIVGITERQFLTKKKELESENMEGLLIERPAIDHKTKRKLLILDVNGLLLHIGNKFDLPSNCIADKFISGKAIFPIVVLLGPIPLLYYLGFYTVENNEKPLMLKELVKLWDKDDPNLPWEKREYNESNSLLVDDSPYKALLNPTHTAIFPTSYDIRDKNDNSLGHGGDIRMYLDGVATSKNVQKYIQRTPFFWAACNYKEPSMLATLFAVINSCSRGSLKTWIVKIVLDFEECLNLRILL
ncbi:hypothetical protein IFM89_018988 [Coptis chinensis]|uniref:Mitochondrial import inner membrane translocase subunit TIM50 n=1 Tax=Coptis chinensis TaxID=261450 RepID=A0A835IEX1_9MAGN|nr:hypothetical protein IFM89_018988 [Coptis chinensis]